MEVDPCLVSRMSEYHTNSLLYFRLKDVTLTLWSAAQSTSRDGAHPYPFHHVWSIIFSLESVKPIAAQRLGNKGASHRL